MTDDDQPDVRANLVSIAGETATLGLRSLVGEVAATDDDDFTPAPATTPSEPSRLPSLLGGLGLLVVLSVTVLTVRRRGRHDQPPTTPAPLSTSDGSPPSAPTETVKPSTTVYPNRDSNPR